MKNTTPLFPGFHLQTLRKTPRSAMQTMANKVAEIKQKTFWQLGVCFDNFIPSHYLAQSKSGVNSRRRLLSKENTFWCFLSQVLDADGGCKEVVRKLQVFSALKSMKQPSSSTSAYCQARKNLETTSLKNILQHTANSLKVDADPEYLSGRRVVVVDGTGVSMPDTIENQKVWPQQSSQTVGCGFPQASICACFCLQTGALLSHEMGNKKSHELPLLRKQWDTFKPNDIFLGDKGFCSYFDVHSFKTRGVDSVVTLARRTPCTTSESVKVLGDNDLLVHWQKPVKNKRSSYSLDDWQKLPEKLLLRQIKVTIDVSGFRASSFYIITTLLDADEYPASDIADLYFQRWDVELFFRDIKSTMGMDILRCQSPDMVRKEILMHLIAYNCIRRLMIESVKESKVPVRRVSFKGCVQALRQWEPHLNQTKINKQECQRLLELLYDSIATYTIPKRPGRSEPRAVKRRPKPFQLLTAPRSEMKVAIHRSYNYAKQA